MTQERVLTVKVCGEPFSGVWRSEHGRLYISSAYGDASAALERTQLDNELLVRRLFREIITDWMDRVDLFVN